MEYVRFQGKGLTRTGDHAGIFGLVNVMGRNGMLTPGEEKFWRENNTWYSAACPDPGQIDPGVFDRAVNPHAAAWFKATASHLIERIPGYLAILDAHHIAWEQLRTSDPGVIIYADDCQVVAIPHPAPQHDRLPGGPPQASS